VSRLTQALLSVGLRKRDRLAAFVVLRRFGLSCFVLGLAFPVGCVWEVWHERLRKWGSSGAVERRLNPSLEGHALRFACFLLHAKLKAGETKKTESKMLSVWSKLLR